MATTALVEIHYPDSDGKPMSDNTKQFRRIHTIYGNLVILYDAEELVFVAGNNLWYPVKGKPKLCQGPDVYVVFGRPKGDRKSYRQWIEDDIPPQVVFEILSESNDADEMAGKYAFYEEHGVEEYYIYNPKTDKLEIYIRKGTVFRRERKVNGFVSPRMRVRFDTSGTEMQMFYPDGRAFMTSQELDVARVAAEQQAAEAKKEGAQAKRLAARERKLKEEAEARANSAETRATNAETRMARLAELARRLQTGQINAEDLAELNRLLGG